MNSVSEGLRVPVERRALRDRVYDLVLEMLTRGDVRPGSRLAIDVVARELDVSPTPVREALVQLERTGLVSREAHRGYRVAPPLTVDEVLQVYAARLVVETGAMELAAPRRSDNFVAELERAQQRHRETAQAVLVEGIDDAERRQRFIDYFEADWDVHHIILRHSDNPYLSEMAESLGTHMHRRRQTLTLQENDVRDAVAEHETIVAALRDGTPEEAVQAMRTHIANVRERAMAAAAQESRTA